MPPVTRSKTRALERLKKEAILNCTPSTASSSLNGVDSSVYKPEAVKRDCPASSVSGSDTKKRKLESNVENVPTPEVSAERRDSCQIPVTDTKPQINKLPVGILIEIFGMLLRLDQNNVKLVCKGWYNVCNTFSVLRTQKMVCPHARKLDSFMLTLQKSQLTWLNVEFNFVDFHQHCAQFWRYVGPRILSLAFVDCELNAQVIKGINHNCKQLQHLSWEYRSPFHKDAPYQLTGSDLYSKLISKPPFLVTLTSLQIHFRNLRSVVKMEEHRFLVALLSKYPNLRSLHMTLKHSRFSIATLLFDGALLKLLLDSRLESLTFLKGSLYLKSDIPNIDQLPDNYTLRKLTFSGFHHDDLIMYNADERLRDCFRKKFKSAKHLVVFN